MAIVVECVILPVPESLRTRTLNQHCPEQRCLNQACTAYAPLVQKTEVLEN